MKNNNKMKKIIFIVALFLGLAAQAQKLKADAIKYKAVTTTQRDAFTVPAGEFWRIYNTTNARFEYWDGDSWEAFLATGGESTTVSDTAELDLTLTGSDITAAIVAGSIDVLKLDAGVQASLALAESALQVEVDGSTTNEIQNASQVASTPSGNLVATDVQAALNELQTELDSNASTDDQTAAEVASTPSGNLTATDVQAALNELQTELDGVGVVPIIDDTAFGVSWNNNLDGASKNSLYDYLINLESLTADDTAYGISWNGNAAAATKNAIYDKIETLGGGSESTTVTDTAEIDLTLTGTAIKADIQVGSIDVLKLDAGVQASLALADSALQNLSEDLTPELGGHLFLNGSNIRSNGSAVIDIDFDNNSASAALEILADANTLQLFKVGENGEVTIGSTTIADINTAGAKAVITKEYGDANYLGGAGESTTVSDTAEIDLTLTGDDITADIVTGSVDVLKLDAGVQASLALADSALQSFTEVDGSTTNELNSSVTMTAGSLGVVDAGGTQSVSLISTDGGNTINAGADGKLYSAAGAGESTTVSDTAEIDLTLTGSDIDAVIITGSIDETKLDASTNASLDLADSALQSFTEVDGSVINELQTIANTSAATTHTATLSNSGGSLQLVEGANITLTTSGTGLNGVVTIAAAGATGESTTVSDTAEIDLTLTGDDITAAIVTGSIDETKLDTSTNTSLNLADSALQSGDNISLLTNDSGYTTGAHTTSLAISTGITGLGTGVATALGNSTNTTTGFSTGSGTATLTNKTISFSNNTLTNVMSTNTAQNVTAGVKKTFQANATNAGFRLLGVTANPSTLTAGDLWYRSDSEKMTYRGLAGARSLVSEDLTQSLTNKTVNGVTLTTAGSATNFLNEQGTYTAPAGGGDVSKVGTPVNNQLGIWTGDGTLEGDVNLTYSPTLFSLNVAGTNNGMFTMSNAGAGVLQSSTSLDIKSDALSIESASGGVVATSDGTNFSIFEQLKLPNYGINTYTGTPAYNLTVDASGNVVESALSGGGDVSKVGTPLNNQGAFWTGASTIEGEPNFTYNGSSQFDFLKQIQVNGRVIADAATDAEAMFKLEIADVNKFVLGNELGVLATGTNNDVINYVYSGLSGSWSVYTNTLNRFKISGSGEAEAFVSMESPEFIDTNGTASLTGTALNLSDNITGKIYNEVTPSTATAFTTTNLKAGGFAYTYINSASEPTVDGSSTESGGSVFAASTLMKLVAYSPDGTTVEHFFVDLSTPSAGGGSSPLTTKGDLYTYSTVDARLAVGTNGQYLTADSGEATGLKWAKPEYSKTITIESPTSSEDLSIFFTNKAITVTEIRAITVGTSPSTTWTIKHETNRSSSGNAIITAGTTTTSQTSGNDLISFNDATILADSFIWLETTAKSGTVQELSITLFYTID